MTQSTLQALAPGYSPRHEYIDTQMVELGRPPPPAVSWMTRRPNDLERAFRPKGATPSNMTPSGENNAKARWEASVEQWRRDVEAWEEANPEKAVRWLELRAEAQAEEARLYEEAYGKDAYALERMRTAGFEPVLVEKASRDLHTNTCFTETRDWLRNGTKWSLVLIGNPGCGKTQAGTWAAFQLLTRNNFAPWCARCPRVSERSLYGMEAEEYRWRCATAAVLLLDDLGEGEQRSEKRGAWRAWVDDVLTQRHAERRKTIITTNRTVPELKAWLTERITDRLREGTVISTNDASMRGQEVAAPKREPGEEG